MRTTLLLLVLLAAPALASQTVWKWVDEKGVTHFSDRSVPGATRVEISRSNSNPASDATPTPDASATAMSAANAGPAYRDFEIWKPSNDESFINTGGDVTVNLRVEPQLQPNHSVFLYLDGALVDGYPGNTLSFDLKGVPRGVHSLNGVINDSTGQRVQETATVSFTVRQESIAAPPVGPSLRPPPKPRPGGTANKLLTSQPTYAALNPAPLPVDPATNKPVVAKPVPAPAGPRQGK